MSERHPPPLPMIPTARLRPQIDRWLASGRTLKELADRAGLHERSLWGIRYEKRHVRFGFADALVTKGLGNVWLWHTAPEDGGFADLYQSPLYVPKDKEEAA